MVNLSLLFWTKENCCENALLFTTKKDWRRNYPSAYQSAHKNGWIDECCDHMIKLGSLNQRLIYAFEFSDKTVYVGLTYNSKNRISRHENDKRSQVYKHSKISGLKPNFIELTSFLNVENAILKEKEFLDKYKSEDWTILNVKKTGSLGGNILYWTKNRCLIDAKKYNTKTEWSKNSTAYDVARKYNWLDECSLHMKRPEIHNKKWTLELCKNEALKYTIRSDWYNISRSSYVTAVKNNWLNMCVSHFKK